MNELPANAPPQIRAGPDTIRMSVNLALTSRVPSAAVRGGFTAFNTLVEFLFLQGPNGIDLTLPGCIGVILGNFGRGFKFRYDNHPVRFGERGILVFCHRIRFDRAPGLTIRFDLFPGAGCQQNQQHQRHQAGAIPFPCLFSSACSHLPFFWFSVVNRQSARKLPITIPFLDAD